MDGVGPTLPTRTATFELLRQRLRRIYALSVLEVPPNGSTTALSSAQDLSSFPFYQRGTIREFLSFFTRTVAERIPQGQHQSIIENNYVFHIYNPVIVTDTEHPPIDTFEQGSPFIIHYPASIDFRELDEYLADTNTRVQAELDGTKIVLHKTIESVLERGEKLKNPVARLDALGASSKLFYSTAKKQNSCCVVM
ncbi:snare protein YKT6 [Phellopilus nigrolimitatus]|nr:snare protein YKT6 [Phellopilus nigrolimitatus]